MPEKYKIEKLPDEPIIIFTAFENFDMAHDAPATVEGVHVFLSDLTEPVYFIHNWLVVKLLDTMDVSIGAMSAALAQNPLFKDPNIREIIFVTTDKLLAASAEGSNSEIYGYVKIHIFPTMAEALRFARAGS